MGVKFERQKEKYKITLIAILLAGSCFLTYFFHTVLETGTVFTHFFYIPIILASLWWKRKGLAVAIFLAVILIVSHIFIRLGVENANDYLRALMFVVIALVVALLSERIAKSEEKLQESEEKYRDIFKNVSDFLYFHDLEGNLIETNLAWKMEYGFSDDDLAHLNLRDLIPERYRNQFDDYLKRVKENGEDEGLMKVITKEDRERIVEYRNSLVFDATGPVGIRGSGRDITERVRAEEALRQERDKLQDALVKVKTLSGMLPICSNCKKIRDDKGYWNQIESYIAKHSEVDFSHSICPECAKKLYPDFYKGD
jgi:PAS domain S-box-containing protein